ncbi:MAG: FAD-dependent oxidoreductase [Xanthomonadaceae bacterium]|nr:FAD-dependent oxidoreductase [Rhodospirillaceae bacterium]NIA17950.1 FAD-dependent oxidoreductase [Xanthomonadaceae bacterium]
MVFDVIIIGAGPAGYTASIYASRYKLKNLIIGREQGGQINEAHSVENYPGFLSISGMELMSKFKKQSEKLGAKIILGQAKKIIKEKNTFVVILKNNKKYFSKTIILAIGMEYRRLEIPGEKKFTGKGVSFCFARDAKFFKNKTVAIIGGGDSAATGAVYLSEIAKKVYLIYRKKELRANPSQQEKVKNNPKIELILNTNLIAIKGDNIVKEIVLDNPFQNKKMLAIEGVFIEVGAIPSSALVKSIAVKVNKKGYINVKKNQSTNIKGIFAAGDITNASNGFRQVITASAEGAIASSAIYKFLQKK